MSIISGMRTASADLNQIGACGAFLSEVADLARQAELDKYGHQALAGANVLSSLAGHRRDALWAAAAAAPDKHLLHVTQNISNYLRLCFRRIGLAQRRVKPSCRGRFEPSSQSVNRFGLAFEGEQSSNFANRVGGNHKRLGKEQNGLDHARLKRATGLMEKLSSSPQRQFERFCCPQFTTRVFRVSVANDRAQLSKMVLAARAAMGKSQLKVLADRGYLSGPEILACDTEGIAAFAPKPSTSASKKRALHQSRLRLHRERRRIQMPGGRAGNLSVPNCRSQIESTGVLDQRVSTCVR